MIAFMILVSSITIIACMPIRRLLSHLLKYCRLTKFITGTKSPICKSIIPSPSTMMTPVDRNSSHSHHLVSSQEQVDMVNTFRELEFEDNLVHRKSGINPDLEIEDGKSIHEIKLSDEEKNRKQTLNRMSESAAIGACIAHERDE